MNKILPIGRKIVILIILITILLSLPSTLSKRYEKQKLLSDTDFIFSFNFYGSILYVGGDGPGNYSMIQSAINNASNGDIVFVFNGIYHENIIVTKTIILIGEDKNTTIIDGNVTGDVVSIIADGVNISGFTVQNSGNTPMIDAGIEVHSDNNSIIENIVAHNGDYGVGIYLNESSNNHISNNIIYENGNEGIYLERSTYNLIQDNEIFSNGHCSIVASNSRFNTIVKNDMYENHDAAVSLWPGSMYNEIAWNTIHGNPYSGMGIWEEADHNTIHNNHFYNNTQYGIKILDAKGNVICKNIISGSDKGLILSFSYFTVIRHNNFIGNGRDAWFDNSSMNRWTRNYWDDHKGLRPKRIDGEISLPWNRTKIVRWINFDWVPLKKPFEVGY